MSKTYGYIRVSTVAQNDARQWTAMENFGIERKFVFADKQSGKDFNRPAYRRLTKKLAKGDVLVIKSLDRLGRNYDEVLNEWRFLTKQKGVAIVVLDLPILDTRQKISGDLTGELISDIVLQLFSYVAQTEREMNRQRTLEGMAAAKARGVKLGRKPLKRPHEYETVKARYEAKEISARKAAELLNISHSTFLKWMRK